MGSIADDLRDHPYQARFIDLPPAPASSNATTPTTP